MTVTVKPQHQSRLTRRRTGVQENVDVGIKTKIKKINYEQLYFYFALKFVKCKS